MGSRLRENPERLFEVFTEVGRPVDPEHDPFVLQQYPSAYKEEDVIKSLPKFVFPCQTESAAVDHFTFVLTDIDSKFKFGFCRHAAGAQTCLCIISCNPWFEVFYKLLNYIAELLNNTDVESVEPLLQLLYDHKQPDPGELVEVVTSTLTQKFCFYYPSQEGLPTIPENRNLTEYYNAVDASNMMIIFASMLNERRVLVVSKKLSRLTSCIHAASALLNPMHWQHLFIPVLPHKLIDYCSAPMPYLIGIHSSLRERVQELGDAVVLDADANTVTSEYDDLAVLPSDVVSSLKKRLKALQSDKMSTNLPADGVSRAFLKALVSLIGGYRDALRFRPGEVITFDPDAFVLSRPRNMRPFLENLLQLQIFEQFINDRLDMLNAGEGFADEFEMEANLHADKWGTQSRYRDWTNNMKKQGKKISREGKDKWVEFTSKVKDRSKKTFKDLRSKMDSRKENEEVGLSRERFHSVQPHRTRPPRPAPPDLSKVLGPSPTPRQSILRRQSYEKAVRPGSREGIVGGKFSSPDGLKARLTSRNPRNNVNVVDGKIMSPGLSDKHIRTRQYKIISVDDQTLIPHDPQRASRRLSSDDSEVMDLNMKRISTDLLMDPDIQSVMKKCYSLEDLIVPLEEDEEGWEDDGEGSVEDGTPLGQDLLDVTYDGGVLNSSPALQTSHECGKEFKEAPSHQTAHLRYSTLTSSASTGQLDDAPVPPPRLYRQTRNQQPPTIMRKAHTRDPLKRQTVYGNALVSEMTVVKSPDANVPQSDLIRLGQSGKQTHGVKTSEQQDSSSMSSLEFDPLRSDSSSSQDELDANSRTGSRMSITRNNAFYKGSKPQSFRRISPTPQATDAQTIRAARSVFMSTEAQKTSIQNTNIKDFDPLLTGQLVVDNPNQVSGEPHHEENLLKEWNLNFDRPTPSPRGPRLNQPGMTRPQYGGFGAIGPASIASSTTQMPFIRASHGPQYYTNQGSSVAPGTSPAHRLGPRISNIMNQLPGDAANTVRQSQTVNPLTSTQSQDPFSDLLGHGSVSTKSQSLGRASPTAGVASQSVGGASNMMGRASPSMGGASQAVGGASQSIGRASPSTIGSSQSVGGVSNLMGRASIGGAYQSVSGAPQLIGGATMLSNQSNNRAHPTKPPSPVQYVSTKNPPCDSMANWEQFD